MTALTEYERLEASGLWRPTPEAQRRDVLVSLGEATLAITDMRERPLSHWSLPAVERLNPGEVPAVFAPGRGSGETLEMDDRQMINAIETVHRAIERRRPRRGWLRTGILSILLAGLIGACLFWLPDALIRHTTAVLPPALREDVGQSLLRQITRLSGEPCNARGARVPLATLSRRVLGPGAGRIVVLPSGLEGAQHLPGGLFLVGRDLIEDFDGAGPVAGYIVAELARAEAIDPVARMLNAMGPWTAFYLLTRGEVPAEALRNYAETLLTARPGPLPEELFLRFMEMRRIPVAPYAYGRDVTGETTLSLIEADRINVDLAMPVLADAEWVALQEICAS